MHERRIAALRRALAEQWPRLLLAALLTAALWPLAGRGASDSAGLVVPHEWPREWDGDALRPLALTAVEQRFAERFPGHIGRFAAEGRVWVLRDVAQPTRALHPASDCFRGLGYHIDHTDLQREGEARLWRCFVAERDGERVRVCERIVDARGQQFIDASSWFWAALLGHSSGPWRAMTRVEML